MVSDANIERVALKKMKEIKHPSILFVFRLFPIVCIKFIYLGHVKLIILSYQTRMTPARAGWQWNTIEKNNRW